MNYEVLCKRDVRSRDRDVRVSRPRRDRDVRKNAWGPSRNRDVRDRDYNPTHDPVTPVRLGLISRESGSLNKAQGHSFWYQSISHKYRLSVGCQ